jgi:hypothetical protein
LWQFDFMTGESHMRQTLICMAAVLFATATSRATVGQEKETDYQKKINAAEWHWSDSQTNLAHCIQLDLEGFEVQLLQHENGAWPQKSFTVRVLKKSKELCSFEAHCNTVFTVVGDALYVADFSPLRPGCSVVAFELKAKKELWRCPLEGLGSFPNSAYKNQVNITTDGGAIVVYGKEARGRYIEYVDAKTGKTLANKMLPLER